MKKVSFSGDIIKNLEEQTMKKRFTEEQIIIMLPKLKTQKVKK